MDVLKILYVLLVFSPIAVMFILVFVDLIIGYQKQKKWLKKQNAHVKNICADYVNSSRSFMGWMYGRVAHVKEEDND